MKVLLALDPHTYRAMEPGAVPRVPYSHDRNLTLLGHEAIQAGHELFVSEGIHGFHLGRIQRIDTVFPTWSFTSAVLDRMDVDCLVSAGIEQLRVRTTFVNAKIVGMLPALHMFESPGLHGPAYLINFLTALREDIDFVITQNVRMAETLNMLAHWLGRIELQDRLIVAPLGFSEAQTPSSEERIRLRAAGRDSLCLTDDHILFLNAGGAWGWTDCDTFIEAVCAYSQRTSHAMRVYFSGIRQPDNFERNPVADRLATLRHDYPQLFATNKADGKIIYIEDDWARGGREIHEMINAADIGIHLNKNNFESWQSHRVRFIDYLTVGLPVLSTVGDITSRNSKDCCFFCASGDVESYFRLFDALNSNRDLLKTKRSAMEIGRKKYESSIIQREVWRLIDSTPRREVGNLRLEPTFFDVYQREAKDMYMKEFKSLVANLATVS